MNTLFDILFLLIFMEAICILFLSLDYFLRRGDKKKRRFYKKKRKPKDYNIEYWRNY